MMDAYQPILDTVRPCISEAANDEPWRQFRATQTVFWQRAPTPSTSAGLSTSNLGVSTFVIVDDPAESGLARLRTFKDWNDNWDAEGSKAPDRAALDFASNVYALLVNYRTPAVTLSAEGHPMFLYHGRLNGEVIVTGDGTFDYFFDGDGAPEIENARLANGMLPPDLTEFLQHA